MNEKKSAQQLISYLFVGGLAFTIEYVSFLILVKMDPTQTVVIPQTISFCLGLVVSFVGSRRVTFKSDDNQFHHSQRVQFISYLSLALLNLVITNILMYMLVERAGIVEWGAKIITMASVVSWNYLIFSKFIFVKK